MAQYEATTDKSTPTVSAGGASTSKANVKRAGRWKRKKGKGQAIAATAIALSAPTAPVEMGKGKWKVGSSQRSKANDVRNHCPGNGYWNRECPQLLSSPVLDTGCGAHISNNLQVLERSRMLSKDEMILKLGNGKAITAKAMGSLDSAISDHIRIELKDCYYTNWIMTAQHKRKIDNHENAQLWHARLGHISKDRMRKWVESKSLEIDDLDSLLTPESYLKGKMTKKLFVGQRALANGLLDLIHTDVCGPLNTPTRGGFSYFITFTNDHSRYGYLYLIRYKSEVFRRFKEYRLEVENQIDRKIKALSVGPRWRVFKW
ncbi:uncharacterized protein LOC105179360 [Sesamum indicum]|uniref:Uncharacterized protein LOC105179360 n=1 Tax=Sesamum indicum TaxID=4182 RepID=A0A6I9UHU6_SESIN|nr:uncharacterized protein LOC105179360 [Sesamum indicum]